MIPRILRGRLVPFLVLVLFAPAVLLAAPEDAAADPSPDQEPSSTTPQGTSSTEGMITVSHVSATDSAGPSTRGLRVGYGYLGGPANDYPWGEYWLMFRRDGDHEIAAAGLSVVPVATGDRRFILGWLLDLGVSRREFRDRSLYAGIVGTGAEGIVRLFRRWDLVATTEAVYRTTGDFELQARVGIRFHHPSLPPIWDGS